MTTFADLGLGEKVLAAVDQMGYTEPTPVQEQSIPLVLQGRDVLAAAQTGTGKTAAFTLPLLDQLDHYKKGHGPVGLIVTPTRELAQQIDDVARVVAKKTGHFILTVVGGTKYGPQIQNLRRGVDLLVATPGRLIDLWERGYLKLEDIQVLVLDEADRMLDMGFWPDVKRIIDQLPEERQTLLFSATLDDSVMKTIGGEVKDPARVEIARKGTAAETIDQYVIGVSQQQKEELLERVLDNNGSEKVVIFTRTKARAETLADHLERDGFSAEAIHGDRSQGQRSRALKWFRDGKVDILVATDVLARGIDVTGVSYVINYDVPMDPEDYIHRIGRTGRAGAEGYAISFVDRSELRDFYNIEFLMKKTVGEMEVEGFEFDEYAAEFDPDRDPTKKYRPAGKGGRKGGRNRDRRRGDRDRGDRRERIERGDRYSRQEERGERPEPASRDRHSERGNFERTERQEANNRRPERGERPEWRRDRAEGKGRDWHRNDERGERPARGERTERHERPARENGPERAVRNEAQAPRPERQPRPFGKPDRPNRPRPEGERRDGHKGYGRDDRGFRGEREGDRFEDRGGRKGGYPKSDGYRGDDRGERRDGHKGPRPERGERKGFDRDDRGFRGDRKGGRPERGENRGYGSRAQGDGPKKYGVSHRKPGDHGGTR